MQISEIGTEHIVYYNWTALQTNTDERMEREEEHNKDRWDRQVYSVKWPLTSVIWIFLAESVDRDREREDPGENRLRGAHIGTLFSMI